MGCSAFSPPRPKLSSVSTKVRQHHMWYFSSLLRDNCRAASSPPAARDLFARRRRSGQSSSMETRPVATTTSRPDSDPKQARCRQDTAANEPDAKQTGKPALETLFNPRRRRLPVILLSRAPRSSHLPAGLIPDREQRNRLGLCDGAAAKIRRRPRASERAPIAPLVGARRRRGPAPVRVDWRTSGFSFVRTSSVVRQSLRGRNLRAGIHDSILWKFDERRISRCRNDEILAVFEAGIADRYRPRAIKDAFNARAVGAGVFGDQSRIHTSSICVSVANAAIVIQGKVSKKKPWVDATRDGAVRVVLCRIAHPTERRFCLVCNVSPNALLIPLIRLSSTIELGIEGAMKASSVRNQRSAKWRPAG
jgi:hypothetical protein